KNEAFQRFLADLAAHLLKERPTSVEEALEQKMDGEKTVRETLQELIARIGENMNLRRFQLVDKTDQDTFGAYIHMGGKISVLAVLTNTTNQEVAKDIAMHIAAINPRYISRDDISAEDVAKEREVLKQQALNEGKPEHIVEKMVEGRLNKFYKEVSLLEQEFVKDPDISVQKY